ncbi:uncharacterized protein LOC132652443 [Meriones unguiculatus]|uniref:uncharacterized protein LOC132652443 n=1 Tax=Meriones unguiculatus TaxID=10047 RepID=UPI00293F07D9|nr:uncharacterized protein LOC132652443 [Meriones unguiculatus]
MDFGTKTPLTQINYLREAKPLRERKENPDDTGLETPGYRGSPVTFYLVDRTVKANPLNKSLGHCGASLSVPATPHSAPAGHSGLRPGRASRAWPGVARLLPAKGIRQRRLPPPGAGRIVRLSVADRLSTPGAARHAHLQPPPPAPGIEAGAQPRGSVSVVRRLAPPRTAELPGHRSRDATKKPVPTSCPEPPPSSPIPERSGRLLAACEALGKGGAGRRYCARVGSGRAEGGVSSLGMGKNGERGGPASQPYRSPAPDPGSTPCLLPTPLSLCISRPGGMAGLQR